MDNKFGMRVRQARKNAGMTQAELAEKLDIDESTVSRIENGSLSTSFATMLHFPQALNVQFDYLIRDYLDGYPENAADPLDNEILEMIQPLPDHYKLLIRDNIKNLIRAFPVSPKSTSENETD